ncbi:MAG: hypothetical protein IPK79_07095 [Vampirovibrionales bacterium]|nr:hypothetical protein [Vampirovibrionales bacterium]
MNPIATQDVTCVERTLGASVQGRPVTAVVFSAPGVVDYTPWDTLFIGAFHGDEGPSADLMRDWIDWLCSDAAPLARLTARGPLGVIAVANPDGLAAQTRVNARGVDLNRNYPTRNWAPGEDDTPYYTGPEPASEPETRLLIALIDAIRPRKIISVHTPYRVVNYDGPAEALAKAMGEANGYPVVADIGYPTPGSFGAYWGIERQISVITLELPEDLPLETRREIILRDNLSALIVAAEFEG